METPTETTGTDEPTVVVGGSGALGATIAEYLVDDGRDVVLLDRRTQGPAPHAALSWLSVDLLVDAVPTAVQGSGPIVLTGGCDQPDAVRAWQLVLDTVLPTARLLPWLADRRVTLLSCRPGSATSEVRTDTDTWTDAELLDWAVRAAELAAEPCPPWRAARLCRRLAEADPGGPAVPFLAARALELLIGSVVPAHLLTVHRVGEILGAAAPGRVTRLVRRAQAGLPLMVSDEPVVLVSMDDVARAVVQGTPAGTLDASPRRLGSADLADLAHLMPELDAGPAIPVVVPPRPELPDLVAERVQASLWSGALKDGPWGPALTAAIRDELQLDQDRAVLLTSSGSAALRLAIVATAGRAVPGDVAVLPSFTFAATGEVAAQLGYRLRFCDVAPDTWTLDADHLASLLAPGDVRVVIGVDTLGAPLDYERVRPLCHRFGAQLVADSAPSLGARHQGRPVGSQGDAHAFSMSFAKVVSAAGGGGAVILPADRLDRLRRPVDWVRSTPMGEVNAVVALDQFGQVEQLAARRRAVVEVLAELTRVPQVVAQQVAPGDRHAWVHWVARFEGVDRERLAKGLEAHGIGSKPYYAPVLHRLDWHSDAEPAGPLPVTEQLGQEALALPMSSELTVADAERVLCTVLTVLRELGVDL